MNFRLSALLGPAGGAVLTVGVLEEGSALSGQLVGAAGLAVRRAGSLDELALLAQAGEVGAAVVDPECGGGWPTSAAEAALERLAGLLPLVLVCRSERDAALLAARAGCHNAAVLVHDRLAAGLLAGVVAGEAAKRLAGPGRPWRA